MSNVRKVRYIIKVIEEDGWYYHHTEGSHRYYYHPTKKGKVTVPGHPNDDMKPSTWRSVLTQAQIDWRTK